MEAKFETACKLIKECGEAKQISPSNADLLELYKYYKQATVGDVTGSRPGMLKQKARAKFDAWTSVKGTSKGDAEAAYVEKAKAILPDDVAATL